MVIPSGGESLQGVLHLPAGSGPHPTVLLLHGFPGIERNFDLAHALRRAGYATLVFHYRGSWGMGGFWAWQKVLDDAGAAATWLRAPAVVAEHALDPGRQAVLGHSAGGFAALWTAAHDADLKAAGAFAAFDFGVGADLCRDRRVREAFRADWDQSLLPLAGTTGNAPVRGRPRAGRPPDRAGPHGDQVPRPESLLIQVVVSERTVLTG